MAETIKITIDKDVELPTSFSRGRPSTYPLREMEIGDSFFIEIESGSNQHNAFRSSVSAFQRRSGTGYKFTVRKEGTGYRCWRFV